MTRSMPATQRCYRAMSLLWSEITLPARKSESGIFFVLFPSVTRMQSMPRWDAFHNSVEVEMRGQSRRRDKEEVRLAFPNEALSLLLIWTPNYGRHTGDACSKKNNNKFTVSDVIIRRERIYKQNTSTHSKNKTKWNNQNDDPKF